MSRHHSLLPAEPRYLDEAAVIMTSLSTRLAEHAKTLAEEPWSDDGEIRLHQNLGAVFDEMERLLTRVGIEL